MGWSDEMVRIGCGRGACWVLRRVRVGLASGRTVSSGPGGLAHVGRCSEDKVRLKFAAYS